MTGQIEIHRDKKNGVLTGRLTNDVFTAASTLPGRKRWNKRTLVFELTRANIEHLRDAIPDAVWQDGLMEHIDQMDVIERIEERNRIDKNRELGHASFDYKTEPYAHQEKSFLLSRDAKNYALLMEMGTGKTKVALDTAAYLYAGGQINALLIVAPNGVHQQWLNEQVPTHLPDWCPRVTLGYVSPSKQTVGWRKQESEFQQSAETLKTLSMHIDAFSGKAGQKYAADFLSGHTALLVVDESTRIKDGAAARTKALLKIGQLAAFRRILSGAPITKGIEDLYTQLKFLDEDILGFSSFYTFRNRFCVTAPVPGAPAGALQIVSYKNLDELRSRLDGHSFRVTKEECLDLPPKVYVRREVEWTAEQRTMYKQLKHELFAQLDDGRVVEAPLAITQLMKMQQVLCGFLQPEDGPWVDVPNNRITTTMDLVNEARGKTIVWARYRADLSRLAVALQKAHIGFREYHGGVSSVERMENLKAFKTDPGVRVFLAQPQSGGTGLNLAEADTAIYFSNDFNADTRWQSEDRIHRIGQTSRCTYIDLVVPDSIDDKILKALRDKKNVADTVLSIRELLQ